MSDSIHKLVTALTNPFNLGLAGLIVVTIWSFVDRRKVNHRCTPAHIFYTFFILWLYLWSTPLMTKWLGLPLESPYPPHLAEEMPTADAICILGGGMGVNTNVCTYADMGGCADRVWHGARLYKAGKAPKITLTGPNVRTSTVSLLHDFGVPDSAFVFFERGHNTEDEAKMISSWLQDESKGRVGEIVVNHHSSTSTNNFNSSRVKPRVLLVTSAWHMRRAQWLFEREGLDVIPAATDYEATMHFAKGATFGWEMLRPDVGCLGCNMAFWKEHFASWCYRAVDWIHHF